MQVWVNTIPGGEVDRHDYDLVQNDDTTIIRFSNNGTWTYPGEVCGSLVDDGNGVKIKIDDIKINLGYADLERLLILLLHNYNGKVQYVETKIVKEI